MTDPAPDAPASPPVTPLSDAEDKQWASFAHFGNILSFVVPLVIWLVFRERGPRSDVEGKEALNWGITVAGVAVILWIAGLILGNIPIISFLWLILSPLLSLALVVVNIVCAVLGGVKVNGGGAYRYPVNLRLVK